MKNRCFLIVIIIIPLFIPVKKSYSQISEEEAKYYPETTLSNNILSGFSGSTTLRYRGRFLEGEDGSDHDFYESLSLNYGNSSDDKISGRFYGTLREDIEDPSSQFRSIDDTYNKSIRGYIYELYSSVNNIGVVENVKIGRQYLDNAENLHLDGLHLSFKPFKNVRLASYGGIPVHFFESSSDGDWISGVSAETKPLENSTIRLDYIFTADNSADLGEHQDNLLILSAWQRIFTWWSVFGRYSKLDSISRDAQFRSSWNFPSANLDIQFSYYKQPQLLDDFTIEFDEFVPIIGGYEPYDQYTLDIYKGIGQYIGINLGGSLRELKDESDERAFNHDYERYYLTCSIFNYPIKGLTSSITGEDYETAGDDVQSLSFDVSKDFNKRLKISLGTYYTLYKFDNSAAPELISSDNLSTNQFLLDEPLKETERDNVRSYYIKVKKKISDRWEISGKYELERFDSDTFHTIETGLRLKF